MTDKECRADYKDSLQYLSTCTDNQVRNIYADETARIKRFPKGDTRTMAKNMQRAAEVEAAKRGISLDE